MVISHVNDGQELILEQSYCKTRTLHLTPPNNTAPYPFVELRNTK